MTDDDPALTVRQHKTLESIRSAIKLAPIPLRSCGDCAKCCEGWLSGTAYGHAFSPGNPCFFLEKTCSIYKDRPVDPCRNYRCAWLSEDTLPMWMKPHLVNLIATRHENPDRGLWYFVIDQAGDTFDQRALSWLTGWAAASHTNVEYRLNGTVERHGSPEFLSM